MKKILITGSGGFIGGHLVKELLNRGYEVRAVDVKKFEEWYQCFENVPKNLENFFLNFGPKTGHSLLLVCPNKASALFAVPH